MLLKCETEMPEGRFELLHNLVRTKIEAKIPLLFCKSQEKALSEVFSIPDEFEMPEFIDFDIIQKQFQQLNCVETEKSRKLISTIFKAKNSLQKESLELKACLDEVDNVVENISKYVLAIMHTNNDDSINLRDINVACGLVEQMSVLVNEQLHENRVLIRQRPSVPKFSDL